MSILLVGSHGNMGRRYRAVLDYLGREVICVDKEQTRNYVLAAAHRCEGIIVATPTNTHTEVIRSLLQTRKPILCEKPITKDIAELKELLFDVKRSGSAFRMVYQYSMLCNKNRIGRTFYNYFKHGGDGLVWDCMQIIGLARGKLELKENSPIWQCMINGESLKIQDMDAAYIGYIQKWFQNPHQDQGEILAVHERTAAAEIKKIDAKLN